MRYSSNTDDRGYANYRTLELHGKKIEVFCNGNILDWVETCDEERGFAIKAKLGDDGNLYVVHCDKYVMKHRLPNGKIISSGSDGRIAREIVRGQITTRIIDRM